MSSTPGKRTLEDTTTSGKRARSDKPLMVLLTDGTESSEIRQYMFPLSEAPKHMRKIMKMNAIKSCKYVYNDIYREDGVESCDGLVDEDEEDEAEERIDEVWTFFDRVITDSKYLINNQVFPVNITFFITVVAA